MPRIRSIKPEHWNDKYLPQISLGAHLLWISLWNFSDDKGVIEFDCLLIKSNSFPRRREIKAGHIKKWVEELIKYEFVIPFEHSGFQYLIHRTFGVHQKIDKPQKSKIPDAVIRRAFDEHSSNNRRKLDDDSTTIRRKDRIGEDRIGEDRIGEDRIGKGSDPPEPIFKLQVIYNKKFEELNGAFKDLTEEGFCRWKKFVDFILLHHFEKIFNCDFVKPQEFEKLDFPESKWEKTLKAILATGVKPEQVLFHRIPQFLEYQNEKHGTKHSKTQQQQSAFASLVEIGKSEFAAGGKKNN